MHCQGKISYVREKVKTVTLIMDIASIGNSREEISQQINPNRQEYQNIHARPTRMPRANLLP